MYRERWNYRFRVRLWWNWFECENVCTVDETEGFADGYVRKQQLESEDMSRFEAESMVEARCVVEHVDSVQDHHTVLSRIEEVEFARDEEDIEPHPLVWKMVIS